MSKKEKKTVEDWTANCHRHVYEAFRKTVPAGTKISFAVDEALLLYVAKHSKEE